jgi:hypothetical protein
MSLLPGKPRVPESRGGHLCSRAAAEAAAAAEEEDKEEEEATTHRTPLLAASKASRQLEARV